MRRIVMMFVVGCMALSAVEVRGQEVHREVVAYFFVSMHCPVSNSPEVREAMRTANRWIKETAEKQGHTYGSVGVATDTHVDSAWAFIRSYDSYDEISVGREFFNTAVMRIMVPRPGHVASTPQVVVVVRSVLEDSVGQLRFETEEEVLRLDGKFALNSWLERPEIDIAGRPGGLMPRAGADAASGGLRRRLQLAEPERQYRR